MTSFKAPQGGGRFSLFASLHGLGDWIAQTTAAPAQPSTDDAPAETASTAPRHNGPVAKPENPNSKNQQSQQPRRP
ncbi:S1 family peptidase [Corynebacterium diphtheriae]|nr:S1 family peptidase [Corynebacterium diphtheriae]